MTWAPIGIDVPVPASIAPLAVAVTLLAALIFWLKRVVLTTLGICAAVGLAAGLAGQLAA